MRSHSRLSGSAGDGSGGEEGLREGGDGGGVGPEFEAWDERAVGVDDGDAACSSTVRFWRSRGARCSTVRPSFDRRDAAWGPAMEEAGAGGGDVGEFDVVHDDEAVEEGDEAGESVRRRFRGGGRRVSAKM